MEIKELIEKGRKFIQEQHHAEAVPLLQLATSITPDEELLWQELALAASFAGQHEQAAHFSNQALRHHPRSGWLWRQLGSELIVLDKLEDAEKALGNARHLDPQSVWLWRSLAALYRKQKKLDLEIGALDSLVSLGHATWSDVNLLGIAYHNKRDLGKALELYRLSANMDGDAAPFFNMGLVLSDPELSQDVDAADCYRQALSLNADYEPAKKQLKILEKHLIPCADLARTAADKLVKSDEYFRHYINPFEAFQIREGAGDREFELRALQRAKKRLLSEIALNDGKIPWLDDYPLDESRTLALENELLDANRRRFHRGILQNRHLLRFLTRGDIEHFLYSNDYFPVETQEMLDEDPEFRAFLSNPFARQFNFILTRAFEKKLIVIVEAMMRGRKWVVPADQDLCFDGTSKRIKSLLEQMQAFAAEGARRKVKFEDIKDFLDRFGVPSLFNLLPPYFRSDQEQMVISIRSLAIDCHNEHDDIQLSIKVLGLCKLFSLQNPELGKKIEDDFKTLQKNLQATTSHQRPAAPQQPTAPRRASQSEIRKAPLVVLGIIFFFILLGVLNPSTSNKPDSTTNNYSPLTTPGQYRVPNNIGAELNREKMAVEGEEAKLKGLDVQLQSLSAQIERDRPNIDHYSEYSVSEFNRKVNAYNELLEQARTQENLVNQMVRAYNSKLQRSGR